MSYIQQQLCHVNTCSHPRFAQQERCAVKKPNTQSGRFTKPLVCLHMPYTDKHSQVMLPQLLLQKPTPKCQHTRVCIEKQVGIKILKSRTDLNQWSVLFPRGKHFTAVYTQTRC